MLTTQAEILTYWSQYLTTKFPDIVVLVPGLIGSILTKDDKPLWGSSPGAVWRVVAGDALEQLRLKDIDPGDEDLGDGIRAIVPVPNVELVPGLWKVGGYSILRKGLISGLELDPGKNFFEFAYDWRRDNRVSARQLARAAHGWLTNWREQSGNGNAKILFVAHSMGGLVARYYIECLEGWRNTKLLVSFGTPYRGSGNALGYLSNGFSWDVGPFQAFDGTEAIRSFDSVYQLLPTYPFVDAGGGDLKRVCEVDLPNIDRTRAVAAALFHDEIQKGAAANLRQDAYRDAGVVIRPVVGTQQPTYQAAKLSCNKGLELLFTHQGSDFKGDRTVPRVSAIPAETSESNITYLPTTHSELQSEELGIGHACGVLSGTAIDLTKYRDADFRGGVALLSGDAYFASQPFLISALSSEYRQILVGKIERLDGPATATIEVILRPSADIYATELTLASGLYRVSVSGDGLKTVRDVFLVADA